MIKYPLRVAVIFGPGLSIKPVWFDLHIRKHSILETIYTWTDLKGSAKRLHFTVRAEGGLYELTYNTAEQTWELGRIEGY
ncbi:MAG: hypothetical protein PHY09_07815 [Desulfuromonadaceae bacterium]|nr:hypothetical protein [Desulfuromonadaceae bacterium]MDD5106624.1 hypothetical protein [Desulfuromonadaceae bacterium]